MFPILFKIGSLTIYTYGVLISLGFIVGIVLALHLGKKQGLPRENILDIGFYILVSAIIGSRIVFVLVEYEHFIDNPLDVFKIWEGGLVFFGGLILAVPVLLIYLKKNDLPVWGTIDLFTPSLALGHAIGRIGCFSAGCCYGKPTDMPWGVLFTHPATMAVTGVPIHPTQLYEAFTEAVIFIFLMLFRRHKNFNGQVFWIYVLLYSSARFIIEFFRGDTARGFIYNDFSIAQGMSILLFIVAVLFLASLRKKQLT